MSAADASRLRMPRNQLSLFTDLDAVDSAAGIDRSCDVAAQQQREPPKPLVRR